MRGSQPLIGVFDSGVGGLTVVAALRRRLPGAAILYLGDTARLPYGTKSRRTVLRYSQTNVDFLERRQVDALVVACNTASAMALDDLVVRAPHWGVLEPGASAAVAAASRHIGVIATESTVRSGAYEEAIRRLDPRLRVSQQACPLLVPLVEEGWEEDEITGHIVARYLEPLLAEGIDTLLLGCTHYPMLRGVLERVCGPEVTLVDAAESPGAPGEPARRRRGGPARAGRPKARVRLFATDAGPRFARLAERILGEPATLEWIDVDEPETEEVETS
ncbi:MAG: glutamate racemase [Holophagales bacterium]|nr:glutamate racemase [Holophagales bacterium]